jgi:hypothetical protein
LLMQKAMKKTLPKKISEMFQEIVNGIVPAFDYLEIG